jgi:hypothetical protein
LLGCTLLASVWIRHIRSDHRARLELWLTIGVSALCVFFIWSGIAALAR